MLRFGTLKDAAPDVSGTVLSILKPSRKTTAPRGGLPVEITAALNITSCPKLVGLRLEVILTVLGSLATFCVSTVEPLLAKLESPLYEAIIALAPGGSDDVS